MEWAPTVILPVLIGTVPVRWDAGTSSEAVAGLLIAVVFGLIGWHTIQLVVLWRRVRKAMGLVLHLPLATALDRIPSRVAAWLKEPPRPGDGRFDPIRRQALALAEQGEADNGAVRAEDAVLRRHFGERRWKTLHGRLRRFRPEDVLEVIVPIRDYLLDHWKAAPVREVFPDARDGKKDGSAGEGGLPGELHAIATAIAGEEVAPARAPKRLPEWVRLAEDLLAMSFLRWLAAALAQVWTLIGFLVVGSVALLFAISSYPFLFQGRLLIGMGLLIGVLILMILAIVVGFNRDEMVSRRSNTAPNCLKIDRHLLGSLATYILPLVGALAAISFNTSDTLRTVIDPILRYLR